MAIENEKVSASESLSKTRSYGKVRCMNPSCMGRLEPSPGSQQITCPVCGMAYRLFWVTPELPRIRGPVWAVNRKIAEDLVAKKKLEASKDGSL